MLLALQEQVSRLRWALWSWTKCLLNSFKYYDITTGVLQLLIWLSPTMAFNNRFEHIKYHRVTGIISESIFVNMNPVLNRFLSVWSLLQDSRSSNTTSRVKQAQHVGYLSVHLVKSLVLTYLLWEWILRWNVTVVGSTLTECFGCSSNNVRMSLVMNNVPNIIKSMWNVKVDKSHLRWRIWLWFTIVTNNNISQDN